MKHVMITSIRSKVVKTKCVHEEVDRISMSYYDQKLSIVI